MVFDESDVALIFQAVKFSADKHRHQRRRGRVETPYINHPIDVAVTLWTVGGIRDVVTLVAAMLHDTIEDTDTTPEEIKVLFGDEVLSLVLEVTDDRRLSKEARRRSQIERAPHLSESAKKIKLADKILNVHDTPQTNWPPQRRMDYLNFTERVVAGLRGVNRKLEDCYDGTLKEARHKLEATE